MAKERERQLSPQTLREVRRVFSESHSTCDPNTLPGPSTGRPGPAPRGKPSRGGGRQHAKRGLGLGKTGRGAVRRGPPSAPVSGATGRGAVPPPTAPTAAPSPTSGRRPRRRRPGAPAHPGSDSAAGTGPPAPGTFSSRPTTGVGGSHPETWLHRAGLGGEPTEWGRGGEGHAISPRAAPAPSARRAWRAGGRGSLDGGSGGALGPEARPRPGRSSPHTLPRPPRTSREQRQSPPPAPPTGGGGGGGGRDSSLSAFSPLSRPSTSREMMTARGAEAAVRRGCPHPRGVGSGRRGRERSSRALKPLAHESHCKPDRSVVWRHLWLGQGRPHKPILRTGLPHQSEGGLRAGAASLSLLQHGLEGGKEVRARPRPRQAGPIAAGSSARAGALPPAPGGLAAAIFGAPVAMAPPPQRPRVRGGPTRGGQSRSLRLLSFHWAGALGGWFAGRRQIRGRAPWGVEDSRL